MNTETQTRHDQLSVLCAVAVCVCYVSDSPVTTQALVLLQKDMHVVSQEHSHVLGHIEYLHTKVFMLPERHTHTHKYKLIYTPHMYVHTYIHTRTRENTFTCTCTRTCTRAQTRHSYQQTPTHILTCERVCFNLGNYNNQKLSTRTHSNAQHTSDLAKLQQQLDAKINEQQSLASQLFRLTRIVSSASLSPSAISASTATAAAASCENFSSSSPPGFSVIREYAHPDDPVSFQGVVAERKDGVGEIRLATVGEGGAGDGCAQSSLGTAMAVSQGGSDFDDSSPSPDDKSSDDCISSAPGSEHIGKKRRDLGLANDGRAWEAHSHGVMDCIGILEEKLREFMRMEEEVVVMKEKVRGIEELEKKMVVLMEVEEEAVDLRRQMETMQMKEVEQVEVGKREAEEDRRNYENEKEEERSRFEKEKKEDRTKHETALMESERERERERAEEIEKETERGRERKKEEEEFRGMSIDRVQEREAIERERDERKTEKKDTEKMVAENKKQVEDAISKVAQKTRDLAEQNDVILAEKVLYPFSCPFVSSSSSVSCVC